MNVNGLICALVALSQGAYGQSPGLPAQSQPEPGNSIYGVRSGMALSGGVPAGGTVAGRVIDEPGKNIIFRPSEPAIVVRKGSLMPQPPLVHRRAAPPVQSVAPQPEFVQTPDPVTPPGAFPRTGGLNLEALAAQPVQRPIIYFNRVPAGRLVPETLPDKPSPPKETGPRQPSIYEYTGPLFGEVDPLVEYQRAHAAKGNPQSQYALGMRFLTGTGVPQNQQLALEWLEKASANGELRARAKLSELRRAMRPPED